MEEEKEEERRLKKRAQRDLHPSLDMALLYLLLENNSKREI
jgi:hypothetical protein